MNTYGKSFRVSTFGESHGSGIGVVIDGCPGGLKIDLDFIQKELERRRPGQSSITTSRKEEDELVCLSGVFEGRSTGAPLSFIVWNKDAKSKDYDHLKDSFRPSHADFTYYRKYGWRDYQGGGRSSARETLARVIAGAVAKLLLREIQVEITGFVSQIGKLRLDSCYSTLDLDVAHDNLVRCPDQELAAEMIAYLQKIKKEGDTVGGRVSCVIKQVPVGLGEPVFDKLHAELAKAMLSINAAKGFEYGSGFQSVTMKGSEHNDVFYRNEKGDILTRTNNSGGIQGGISNGMDIYFNVAFKPVATVMKEQKSVNSEGEEVTLKGTGRHDPCVVPRAVPIVEAMAAIVLADFYLRNKRLIK